MPAPAAAMAAQALMGSRFAGAMGQAMPALKSMGEIGKTLGGAAAAAPLKMFGDLVVGAGKMLYSKLIEPLKPLAVLSAAMQSSVSGQSVYQGSLKMLATVVGSVLTPLFLTFAVGVHAVASYLADNFLPELEELYTSFVKIAVGIYNKLLPTFELLGNMTKVLWASFKDFAAWVDKAVNGEAAKLGPAKPGEVAGPMRFKYGKGATGPAGDSDGNGSASGAAGAESKPTESPSRIGQAIKDTMAEFRRANSPQAQSSGLVDAYKRSLMGAMTLSPYEQKMLTWQQQIVNSMEKVAGKVEANGRGVRVN